MITLWETQAHYGRHLRPIAAELKMRGVEHMYVPAWEIPAQDPDGVLVVAAYRDLKRQRRWRGRVLVEHGVGQSYSNQHHGYPGGRREPYDLLLAPGPEVEDLAAGDVAYVGCLPIECPVRAGMPGIITFMFHWQCHISIEAGTALDEYLPILEEASALLYSAGLQPAVVLHPRWNGTMDQWFAERGFMTFSNGVDGALWHSTIIVADNTSAMFEAAYNDVPVIVLNHPTWRRDVEHGKRFWEWADVGVQADNRGEFFDALEATLGFDPQRARRREIAALAYSRVGSPRRAAVDAITGLL